MPQKLRKDTYRVALSSWAVPLPVHPGGRGSIRSKRVVRLLAAPAVKAVTDAHARVAIVQVGSTRAWEGEEGVLIVHVAGLFLGEKYQPPFPRTDFTPLECPASPGSMSL